MRAALLALLALAAAGARGQDRPQQPPTPTFRADVDIVSVDVTVVDKDGHPVPGLTAQDFTLTVDGKPRTVTSAQFVSIPGPASMRRPPAHYSTNAGAASGRLIMLVIDAANIGAGRGQQAVEAARRFIRTLSPADRVALVAIPTGTPFVDFTSSHDLVEAALARTVNAAADRGTPPRVGIAEALALERNDTSGLRELLARECPADTSDACLQPIVQEAEALLGDTRQRARASLAALRSLFDRLAASPTPKTLVLISDGLLIDRDVSAVAWVGGRASAAHTTLYALQLEQSNGDVSSASGGGRRGEDRELLREGLDAVAGPTRGDVFRVASTAEFAFDRLSLELSGYYLLGFEPQPGDRDAKPHRIRIDVPRKDLVVRSRREFTAPQAAPGRPADVLLETLKAPLPASDIPLALTTYAFRDTASAQLKLVVVAQIDRSRDTRGRVALAYALVNDSGKTVASQVEQDVTTPISLRSRMQKYVGSARVAPGDCLVRLAVVDEGGRRGSVERPVSARLHAFGGLQVSDVLVADNSEPAAAEGLMPSVTAEFTGTEVHGYVEVYGERPDALVGVDVRFEISAPGGPAALGVAGHFQPVAEAERRRVADATIPITLLPPGDYVVRAVILAGGQRVGAVEHPFTVLPRR